MTNDWSATQRTLRTGSFFGALETFLCVRRGLILYGQWTESKVMKVMAQLVKKKKKCTEKRQKKKISSDGC